MKSDTDKTKTNNQDNLINTLNEKHIELLNYLKLHTGERTPIRKIISDTTIDSVGSVSFALHRLVEKGHIKRVGRSSWEVVNTITGSEGYLPKTKVIEVLKTKKYGDNVDFNRKYTQKHLAELTGEITGYNLAIEDIRKKLGL